MKEPTSRERGFKNALAGAIAGAISKTTMAPVERVKLLLQLQDSAVGITGKSTWEVARGIYYDEGKYNKPTKGEGNFVDRPTLFLVFLTYFSKP